MPVFSQRSRNNLATCVPEIQEVCAEAIQFIDFAVTDGHRTDEEQDELYAVGRTKPGRIVTRARGGQSDHNKYPSPAFDYVPWPVDWNDLARFGEVAGVLLYIAWKKGIDMAWLGDSTEFKEYPHIWVRGY